MSVPLLDVTRLSPKIADALDAAAARVLRSGRFILGPEVDAFERECAEYLGVEHAVGVSSGSDALLATLMALGVGPGDEVIVPTFTFFATAGAVARLGATPVFVDSDPLTLNMDISAAVAAMGPRTRAVIPVQLFGLTTPIAPLLSAAEARGVTVIEDAAQAFGARCDEGAAGTRGAAGCHSFFPSKTLGGFGDGGLVTTNDPDLAEKVRVIRAHGSKPKYHHRVVGGNFRLDALQAALLRVKLPGVDEEIRRRRAHASRYREALGGALVLPADDPHHTYNQFVIRFETPAAREAARARLRDAEIGHAVYYPAPLHTQKCFGELPPCDAPVANAACETGLAIPVFGGMTAKEQTAVIHALMP